MSASLFLHEVVDIVGEGARPYMELMVRTNTDSIADRGMELFGTFQVVGMTGRWPQVINVWTIDGWEGWRRSLVAANLKREENTALKEWWDDAYRHRSGGFDRLLRATTVDPAAKGELFVHEISKVRPGAGPDYLAAVREQRVPAMAERGIHLVGLYDTVLDDTEVCTIWATDIAAHTDLLRDGDPWPAVARRWCTRWHEELMTPGAGSPLAPPEDPQ